MNCEEQENSWCCTTVWSVMIMSQRGLMEKWKYLYMHYHLRQTVVYKVDILWMHVVTVDSKQNQPATRNICLCTAIPTLIILVP